MGRSPCCDKTKVKKGPWSNEEDALLINFVANYGNGGNWISLPKRAGLNRCGKSCRLRWLNYLRPDINHGEFTDEEDHIIYTLYNTIGSRWSMIASKLPGRTDNDVKNYWNTKLKKKISLGKFESKKNYDSSVSSYINKNSELDIQENHRQLMLHNQISRKCYTTSSGSSLVTEEMSSSSRSSSSSSTSSLNFNQSNNNNSFDSIGFSREDDEFWMELLSDSFDDGFIVGSMLDEKIHEIASLLDDSFNY